MNVLDPKLFEIYPGYVIVHHGILVDYRSAKPSSCSSLRKPCEWFLGKNSSSTSDCRLRSDLLKPMLVLQEESFGGAAMCQAPQLTLCCWLLRSFLLIVRREELVVAV